MGVELKKTFDHVNVPKSAQKKKALEALELAKERFVALRSLGISSTKAQ